MKWIKQLNDWLDLQFCSHKGGTWKPTGYKDEFSFLGRKIKMEQYRCSRCGYSTWYRI